MSVNGKSYLVAMKGQFNIQSRTMDNLAKRMLTIFAQHGGSIQSRFDEIGTFVVTTTPQGASAIADMDDVYIRQERTFTTQPNRPASP